MTKFSFMLGSELNL